ncbi:HAD family phosphatase [Candidatus Microgenomates bacterium]|nr:HAD family phosphatase [Candidatus Microgenomates bacterium]
MKSETVVFQSGLNKSGKQRENGRFKAIIFDLDGLLIDSEPIWVQADKILMSRWGISYTNHLREKIRGRGQQETAEIIIKQFRLKESIDGFVKKRWESLYPLLDRNLQLMPGAESLVKKFYQSGFILAIATGGHQKRKVEEFLTRLTLRKFFKVIVSGLDVKHSKPYPDIFLACAQRLEVLPSECLVLEDAENGVIAAKRAGMKVIGVNSNPRVRKFIRSANLIVESLREVTLKKIEEL